MSLEELKREVVEANKELPAKELVKYSWGECECYRSRKESRSDKTRRHTL